MLEINYPDIKSLPQFERLIQPARSADIKYLHTEIAENSSSRIIHTWRGNHLVDKERYECCIELNLPVEIKELFFDDWLNAAIYICSYELKNPSLTDEYRKYLIGQYFHYKVQVSEKSSSRGLKYSTANDIAHELYISSGTVMKYGVYSEAMNAVFDQSLEFGQKILLNNIRVSHENVIELSRLKSEEIRAISQAAARDNIDHLTLQYIRNEVKWSYIMPKGNISRRERAEKKAGHAAIRQMPKYDPDAEVNSLCMTIDSWISSIQRVSNSENFAKITSKASLQLMKKLSFLEHTVNAVQELLVERTNE